MRIVPATIAQVARLAGVSKSTAQRALAGDAWVSPETRQAIEGAAARLGWRRDPALSALAERRWGGGRRQSGLIMLADGGAVGAGDSPAWNGMSEAAERLGYDLGAARIGADGTGWDRVLSRKVAGVVVSGITYEAQIRGVPWSNLVSVSMGVAVPHLPLHAVDSDAALAVDLAWGALHAAGCRRIAMIHLADVAHIHNAERLGRYLWHSHRDGQRPLLCEASFGDHAMVRSWARRTKPDGIIGINDWVYWLLRDDGWKLPGDAAYVSLFCDHRYHTTAGVMTCDAEQGRATVEMLDLLIARQALGFPETPRIIRVPPTWRRGPTLREAEQATA